MTRTLKVLAYKRVAYIYPQAKQTRVGDCFGIDQRGPLWSIPKQSPTRVCFACVYIRVFASETKKALDRDRKHRLHIISEFSYKRVAYIRVLLCMLQIRVFLSLGIHIRVWWKRKQSLKCIYCVHKISPPWIQTEVRLSRYCLWPRSAARLGHFMIIMIGLTLYYIDKTSIGPGEDTSFLTIHQFSNFTIEKINLKHIPWK